MSSAEQVLGYDEYVEEVEEVLKDHKQQVKVGLLKSSYKSFIDDSSLRIARRRSPSSRSQASQKKSSLLNKSNCLLRLVLGRPEPLLVDRPPPKYPVVASHLLAFARHVVSVSYQYYQIPLMTCLVDL